MFSPHLYDHKFDIDDLINALLGERPLFLNTRTGELASAEPAVDDAHKFRIDPLPLEWLNALEDNDEYLRLLDAERVELERLIATVTDLGQLKATVFGPSQLGGWLRERLKHEALQWLARHNLIPPSMRHISGVPKAPAAAAPKGIKKVTIGE